MPTFFDPDRLTPEQSARWDRSLLEYARVQEANLDQSFATLTSDDLAEYCARHGLPAGDRAALRAHWRMIYGSLFGNAGHPKSALFARLLSGRPALPFPPPTSYSYPWYAVIDDEGPFPVSLDGAVTLGSLARGTGGAAGMFAVGINQCDWAVVQESPAFAELRRWQDALEATRTAGEVVWTHAIREGVAAAYAAQPTCVVRHGPWPDYRLFVAPHTSWYRGDTLLEEMTDLLDRGDERLAQCQSVFDLTLFCLNATVRQTEDQRIQLVRDGWWLEREVVREARNNEGR